MTYVLYNPLANGGRGEEGLSEVKAALAPEALTLLDVTAGGLPGLLAPLTGEDRLILCGGDGTMNRFVNDLEGKLPPADIFAWRFGTGNDFLRDITDGTEEGPLIPIREYLADLPTAQVRGRTLRFLNGCSVGVDAVVCAMMEENRLSPKKTGYAATALRSFFRRYKPMPGRVTVDGETRVYDRLWMAASMNGRFQGGGMKFAPDQDRRGDTLCCMVWHGTSALGTLLRFPSVIPGKHTGFPFCDMRFGHEITVELDGSTVIQLDGEVIRDVSGYTARKGPQGDTAHDA